MPVATAHAPGRLRRLARSSVGAKLVMALTGLVMLGFLVGHLAGNLLLLKGPDALNGYALWLREHGGLLWTARLVLLGALFAHVATGLRLARLNRAARPVPYVREETLRADPASRTMALTGLLVLAYLAYHLAHLTFHWVHAGAAPPVDALGRLDVHAMVVRGFRSPAVALTYLVAQGVLGFHLWHGTNSLLQTLGINHPAWNRGLRVGARAVAILLVLGYASLPLAVWAGAVP